MKVLALTLFALMAVAAAPARQQSLTSDGARAPAVAVIKFSWDKERIGWEGDPFAGPVENFDEMRVRARNEKRIDDAKKSGSPEVDRIKREARADSSILERARQKTPPRYAFRYTASFKNIGGKTIKQIDWDYLFFDAATNRMVGRIEFGSDMKIEPGKKKGVSFFLPTPPAKTISVQALNDKERQGLTERIILVRVVYADGSVWQRAPEPAAP